MSNTITFARDQFRTTINHQLNDNLKTICKEIMPRNLGVSVGFSGKYSEPVALSTVFTLKVSENRTLVLSTFSSFAFPMEPTY